MLNEDGHIIFIVAYSHHNWREKTAGHIKGWQEIGSAETIGQLTLTGPNQDTNFFFWSRCILFNAKQNLDLYLGEEFWVFTQSWCIVLPCQTMKSK